MTYFEPGCCLDHLRGRIAARDTTEGALPVAKKVALTTTHVDPAHGVRRPTDLRQVVTKQDPLPLRIEPGVTCKPVANRFAQQILVPVRILIELGLRHHPPTVCGRQGTRPPSPTTTPTMIP